MNDDSYDFYSNSVFIATSLYDVTLSFRTQSPSEIEEGKTPSCNVRMSLQHAKSLAAILIQQILDYEKANDVELPVPSNAQEAWNKYIRKGE